MSVHDCFLNMLDVLFKEDLVGMWSTMHPSEEQNLQSLSKAPSSSSDKRYCRKPGVDKRVFQHIRDCLRRAFSQHSHGETFWENALLQFRCSFSSTLISYRLEPKEIDTISGLVLPMLKTLIQSISLLPDLQRGGFRSHVLVGESIPKVEAGRGRNPEVDVVVQLVDQQSKNIRITPIEAKEVIQKKNIAQLCTYMFRLASADDLGGSSIVGFLVDGYNLQMCVCCTQIESVLMPYFFVSPSIRWRTAAGVNVDIKGLLLLTTSVFLLDLPPISCELAPTQHLLDLAKANKGANVTLHAPALVYRSLNHTISRLEKTIAEHEKSLEELAAHARQHHPSLKDDFGSPSRKRARTRGL